MIYSFPFVVHGFEDPRETAFPPFFLQDQLHDAGRFVQFGDGYRFVSCDFMHSYLTGPVAKEICEEHILLLQNCPKCNGIQFDGHRKFFFTNRDFLDDELFPKFDSMEMLVDSCPYVDESSLKLVRTVNTLRGDFNEGPVASFLNRLPAHLLEDHNKTFYRLLKKMYTFSVGFVKGKYLVISVELLVRVFASDVPEILRFLSEAYALVQSNYCSISRMAFEGGFWQVCPEFGAFYWMDNVFERDYPFLRDFMRGKNIFVKNFSLSIGPHYVVGGGYFSYISNVHGNIVIWFVPNFWLDSLSHFNKAKGLNSDTFWFGWHYNQWRRLLRYGYNYNCVSPEQCNQRLLGHLSEAVDMYYN